MGSPLQFPAFPESAFAPFYDTEVFYSGKRGERVMAFATKAFATEGDANASVVDAPAPSAEQTWTFCIRFADWLDETPPQREDEIMFAPDGIRPLTFRVSSATPQHTLGHYEVVARTRGGRTL